MSQVTFELMTTNNIQVLKMNISGLLTYIEALSATEKWQEIFDRYPDKKFVVIFDCKEMSDYESLARIVWQDTIILLKKQISTIWVITDSKVVAAGVGLMSIFTSFKIKIVPSQDKIILQSDKVLEK